MQQSITLKSSTAVATDPLRKRQRYLNIIVGSLFALAIASIFLPIPLPHELFWNYFPLQSLFSHSFNNDEVLSSAGLVALWMIMVFPFFNIRTGSPEWKKLERARQRAVRSHFSSVTAILPFPAIFAPFPSTVSVRLRRNWLATCIAGAIYAPLIGLILWIFVSGWQMNMQYLVQHGEISGWLLLGSILYSLLYWIYILPAIITIIFAPRQLLIATQEGLFCRQGLRFSSISWSEARLFAVIAELKGMPVYELASSTSIIRWAYEPGSDGGLPTAAIGIAPFGLVRAENSTEEYQWQIGQITALVAAGTGLPLCDLR
jgi:hypothetical protein